MRAVSTIRMSASVRLMEMANERGGPDNITVILAVMEAS